MAASKYTLQSTAAYESVFARFLHSMEKKLLLHTDVALLSANPSVSSLETFRPSPFDHFEEGSIPETALREASHRHALETKRKIEGLAKKHSVLGRHHDHHHASTPTPAPAPASSSTCSRDAKSSSELGRLIEDHAVSVADDAASRKKMKKEKQNHKEHEGHGHGHHHHHDKHMLPEISHRELFFDLIYVVVCIELGTFLHYRSSWDQLGYTFLLFVSFWLDWFHTNAINSCIRVTNPWLSFHVLVVLGALGLAAHAISVSKNSAGDIETTDAVGPLSTNRLACALFMLLPRLAFLTIYANVWFFTDKHYDSFAASRLRQSGIFCICFLISTSLCVAMACTTNDDAVLTMWILLDLVEVLVYPIAALVTRPELQWKVAPAFAKERDMIWVFIVLGESMISLGMYGQEKNSDYYLGLFLGFALIYTVMRLFIYSQPTKTDVIRHALYSSAIWVALRNLCLFLMSFGLLCIGVALKSVMLSPEDDYVFTRRDSLLLTCGVSCAMFFMNLCRFTHVFIVHDYDPHVYGINYNAKHGRYRRYGVWSLQTMLSLSFIPLGLLVTDDGTGLSAPGLVALMLGCVTGMGLLDLASRPTGPETELMLRMKTPLHLDDLLAGFDSGSALRRSPTAAILAKRPPLTPLQSQRARRRWAHLLITFQTCKYVEKKMELLKQFSSQDLVRPGQGHLGEETPLKSVFGDAILNRSGRLVHGGLRMRKLSSNSFSLSEQPDENRATATVVGMSPARRSTAASSSGTKITFNESIV